MRAPVQRFRDVVVSGLAHVDAPHIIRSDALEEELRSAMDRLRLRAGMLSRLTGIVERRFWDPGTQPSTVAAEAGELALQRSGVRRDDIGVLVNTSVSRDYVEPATASIVHSRLGLAPEARNFDVGNACLGFLDGMSLVATLIEHGQIDHGIVVNGESSRNAVEATVARLKSKPDPVAYREQFPTLTLGSGAAAMVLSRADSADGGHRFLGGVSRAGTEHAMLCTGQLDEMRTDAGGLLRAGLEVAAATWKDGVDLLKWGVERFAMYAIHQVSAVHTRAVSDTLGLDRTRLPLLFPRFGNIGPASIPVVLSKAAEAGSLRSGDRIAMMGVGSGINASAAELVW